MFSFPKTYSEQVNNNKNNVFINLYCLSFKWNINSPIVYKMKSVSEKMGGGRYHLFEEVKKVITGENYIYIATCDYIPGPVPKIFTPCLAVHVTVSS